MAIVLWKTRVSFVFRLMRHFVRSANRDVHMYYQGKARDREWAGGESNSFHLLLAFAGVLVDWRCTSCIFRSSTAVALNRKGVPPSSSPPPPPFSLLPGAESGASSGRELGVLRKYIHEEPVGVGRILEATHVRQTGRRRRGQGRRGHRRRGRGAEQTHRYLGGERVGWGWTGCSTVVSRYC